MENTKPDIASTSIQEIEQELFNLHSHDFRGVAPGKMYRAAVLYARINKEFEDAQGRVKVLGFKRFVDWIDKFRQTFPYVSTRTIYYYVKIGRHLVPRISEAEFNKLGIEKAKILAAEAKAGRLSADNLNASYDCSRQELKERAAPRIGEGAGAEEHITIDSHEAAVAALLRLGHELKYEVFTAHPGDTFKGQKLSKFATLTKLPPFATKQIENSVTKIDVIWVKEDYPQYFFEVENTTGVTPGLGRMYQAVKYVENCFIVGPEDNRQRFDRETKKKPYKAAKQKYIFRSYNELTKMFRVAMKYCDARDEFFDKQGPAGTDPDL